MGYSYFARKRKLFINWRRSVQSVFIHSVVIVKVEYGWVLISMGVYYISPQSNYIKWYYEKHKQNSLSGNAVSQFSEDPDGNLWIATENGGLNYFNPRTEEFTRYMANGSFLRMSAIIIYMLYYWTIISYG